MFPEPAAPVCDPTNPETIVANCEEAAAGAPAAAFPEISAIRAWTWARSRLISTVFDIGSRRNRVSRRAPEERPPVLIETFPAGPLACNCTILADEASGEAIVLDGGDGVAEVERRLAARNLRATYLLHTHAHIDHIGDLGALRDRAGGQALLHPADVPLYQALEIQASWISMTRAPRIVKLDGDLADGDSIRIGDSTIEVLHTPGHTPGSVCFALDGKTIFSGDTLFAGSIGRWDLGGTSMEDIVASIHRKLLPYPDQTQVVPGHGPSTTIGVERNANPYLQ